MSVPQSNSRNPATSSLANSPNRLLGVVAGAIYILIGLFGFTSTGDVGMADPDGGLFLGFFEVNPLHNSVHLVIGAALLIAGVLSVRAAKTTNAIVGVAYLLLGLIGLFIVDSAQNFLALNAGDNALHLVSGAVLLAVALAADRWANTETTSRTRSRTTTGDTE